MRYAALALFLLIPACPPSPAPPPPADAGPPPTAADAAGCPAWCASWQSRGCKEATANCVQTCSHVIDSHLFPIDPNVCTK